VSMARELNLAGPRRMIGSGSGESAAIRETAGGESGFSCDRPAVHGVRCGRYGSGMGLRGTAADS